MKRPFNRLLLAVAVGTIALAACSAQQSATTASKSAPGDATVRKALTTLAPKVKIDSMRPAPIAGLTEVTAAGQTVYVTNDGKYLVSGSIVEIATKRDLTELARAATRREALKTVTASQMIVFAPAKPKYTVTVFTDVDCAYCRKLHSQIADYNKAGIAVDYLFFPRAGIPSESYDKAVSVWCATNRQQALTDAKKGLPVPKATCANPVTQDYDLGRRFGFDGTPAIYTADGTAIGGYLSPTDMKAKLDQLAAKPNS
ncbi:MAG TPA: thioredoxin fold domain-containing protein [Xanthomonadaceae bacterium]|nr:thioredoxin fold domain-containing protein [Xanthomonadaceae bacterium]